MRTLILLLCFYTQVTLCATHLFFNGKIVEKTDAPLGDWLLVRDGRVVLVGTGKAPEVTGSIKHDLLGRFLSPSITDSHVHLTDLGREHFQASLEKTKSAEEAVEKLKSFLKLHPVAAPSPILGSKWDQSDWPGGVFPERQLLDGVSETQPIILYRIDGHAAWVNTVALKNSGIWDLKTDPVGGKILRDAKGLPTGVLIDNAMNDLSKCLQKESNSQLQRYLKAAVEESLSYGVTSVHDMGTTSNELDALRIFLQEPKNHFRVISYLSSTDEATLNSLMKRGIEVGSINGRLSVRGVKLFLDGAMGSRGAAFEEPYADDPKNKGLLFMTEPKFIEQIKKIDAQGFQVAVHAIGSLANKIAINGFEKAFGADSKTKRPRIEHAQILEKRDIDRMGKLGIVASMQPTHVISDMKWVIARIGKKRARYGYAWNSLLKAQAPLAFGSDAPVESINPWPGLFASVTRQSSDFKPQEGFFPEERISLKQAFRAFTEGAAYAGFEELTLGDLTPGKWADFIITKENPLETGVKALDSTLPLETWIAGTQVYQRP